MNNDYIQDCYKCAYYFTDKPLCSQCKVSRGSRGRLLDQVLNNGLELPSDRDRVDGTGLGNDTGHRESPNDIRNEPDPREAPEPTGCERVFYFVNGREVRVQLDVTDEGGHIWIKVESKKSQSDDSNICQFYMCNE